MRYWVYINSEILGPYEVENLAGVANFNAASLISPEVRPEGEAEAWKAASVYPEVMAALSARTPGEKASGRAISALILGIASYFPGFLLLTGVPAWILGKKELKAIEAGLAPARGKRLAQVGMWLGIVSVVFPVLAVAELVLILYAA